MNSARIHILIKPIKKIVAFGNPLLDTTIFINDNYLLKKYSLKENDQKEVTKSELDSLTLDISEYMHYVNAGGCAQNCLRVLQWLLKKQCQSTIFGSVGNDTVADFLRKLMENDGVKTRYIIQKDLPTGKTVGLVRGHNRSLVAYIGAAEKLPLDDLLVESSFQESVATCDFVYMEGFFLTNRTETARYILNSCNEMNKILIFNISGEYVCDILPDTVKHFVENSDVIFGNKREFEATRKIMQVESLSALACVLTKNTKRKMKKYGNIVVITDGPERVTCMYDIGRICVYEVPRMKEEDIKDTTGAGDAFAGGFIAGLCRNASIEECVRIGCYSANMIIRQIGCSMPKCVPDIFVD